jgi:hypothetical protein
MSFVECWELNGEFLCMNYCYANLPVVQRDQYAKWYQVGCWQNKDVEDQSAEEMTSLYARED